MERYAESRNRALEKVSEKQLEVIVDFMKNHVALATNNLRLLGAVNTSCNARARFLWDKLAKQVNAVNGGSKKKGKAWRKYWTDWKCKLKNKLLEFKKLKGKPDGENCKRPKFSYYDLKVIKLLEEEFECENEEDDYRTPPRRSPRRSPPAETYPQPKSPGASSHTSQTPSVPSPARVSPSCSVEWNHSPERPRSHSPERPRSRSPPHLRSRSSLRPRTLSTHRPYSETPPRSGSKPQRSRPRPTYAEPEEIAWMRRMEEKKLNADIAEAQARVEYNRQQGRLVDLLEQYVPLLVGAFTRMADALEKNS